ncbi:MAG: hypothetical protein M1813_000734 [Trichoglossum hirsutum]|nr:MAG: hypothetical protein M1813_000734 [Trichoglossum hirsutum]
MATMAVNQVQAQASSSAASGETGLCLLSLDGGGVRGLSTLHILKTLMAKVNSQRLSNGQKPVKPCQLFDLIGGTSTGGLIGIMLGRLEMDVDECIAVYTNLMGSIFGHAEHWLPVNLKGNVQPRFDAEKLKQAIIGILEGRDIPVDEMLDNGKSRGCRTFVCATRQANTNLVCLRDYTLIGGPNYDTATIVEAALATSAATTFFPPVKIGERLYVDGALGANNPVNVIWNEAQNIWSPDDGDIHPNVKCFVSVGTGNPGSVPVQNSVVGLVMDTLKHIASETERTATMAAQTYRGLLDTRRYFRFNVEQGLQQIGLEEHKRQGEIEVATIDYIWHMERRFAIRDCANNLNAKKGQQFPSEPNRVTGADHVWTATTGDSGIHHGVNSSPSYNLDLTIEKSAAKAHWSVPFLRNERFVGRSSTLSELETTLLGESHCRRVAIAGLGGMGKTQIALELAYRVKEDHTACSVFWVPASTADNFEEAYLKIGKLLQLPGLADEGTDVKELIRQHLSQEDIGRWLMILDNTDDIELWFGSGGGGARSTRLVDFLPKGSQGSLLVTTRNRKVAVKLAQNNVIEVAQMDEETATQMLKKSLVHPEVLNDEEATQILLKQLAYLPLAVIQAAAYINENKIPISEYLSLLEGTEECVIEILSEDFEDEGRCKELKNPVVTTWLTSYDQIRQRHPLAADYLSFMSCLDPRNIPQSLLPPAPSGKAMLDAIGTLSAYYFIITRHQAGESFDLHPLVHLATRNWLRWEDLLSKWTKSAVMRLTEVLSNYENTNRLPWNAYFPHARYILAMNPQLREMTEVVELSESVGLCLLANGRYNEAEESLSEVMEMKKRILGQKHPDTLTTMAYLASTIWNQGRRDQAEELEVQVANTRIELLGQEHPATLTSLVSLASMYRDQGRWREAEELEVKMIQTGGTVLGQERLTSLDNLALIYRNQGRWKEAKELEVQLTVIVKRILSQGHHSMLSCVANLASANKEQRRWKEAEELFLQVVEVMKRVLGEEHPETLTSMANLTSTYYYQGRLEEAEKLGVQVMEMRKGVLGEKHLDTLTSIAHLTITYYNQGRLEETEKLEVQVMEARKSVLGEKHPDTLTSMANLAATYNNQGRLEEAEKLGVQVMEMRKGVLGEKHPDTLTSMASLAATYNSQGRLEEAEKLGVQVMEMRKGVLGEKHPDTLTSMANLANTYYYQGRLEEAGKLVVQVMETRKSVLGEKHPNTLVSMADLVAIYNSQRRLEEAERLGTQVVEMGKGVLGERHPDMLTSMANLANTYYYQGRLEEAGKLVVQVMETRKSVLGEKHPNTLVSMADLVAIYNSQRRLEEAERLGTQVVEMGKGVLGERHPDMLTSMANLAATYYYQGRLEEAGKLGVQVMEMRKGVLGEKHLDTLMSIANLVDTYNSQGRLEEAEKLGVQVMEVRKSVLGEKHPDTLTSMAILANTYYNQGRLKEAGKLGVQVMEMRKGVLGEKHLDTLTSMASLASILKSQKRYQDALSLATECFRLQMETLGLDHPATKSSMLELTELRVHTSLWRTLWWGWRALRRRHHEDLQ